MKTYVTLLRGINVGGNNKVEMKRLKALFESMGFADVSTYINSGNVIFSSQDEPSAAKIENQIEKTFGFTVRTLVREMATLKKLTTTIPIEWSNNTNERTEVFFLWDEYNSKKILKLIEINPDVDELVYVAPAGAIVWHIEDRTQYRKSALHKLIGTVLYKHMTARNINTVRKLVLAAEK